MKKNTQRQIFEYLISLDEKGKNIVLQAMIDDIDGKARPLEECSPPCSGTGNTPNGYWRCVPPCTWIPET